MEEKIDRLIESEMVALLSTQYMGRSLVIREELGSTSEEAWKGAEKGAPHGSMVVANCQTKGRGRRGRSWISPGGMNLYFSVILRPSMVGARAPEFTLVAAIAICEALRENGCAEASIKWPNDVEVGGKKVAGILTELSATPEQINFLILGIGVNVNMLSTDFPDEIQETATSTLVATGRRFSRSLLLAALLAKLENWLEVHQQQGFDPVRRRWRELSSMMGVAVRVEINGKYIQGIAEDIDEQGHLLVKKATGVRDRVVAGDVQRLRTE